MKEIFMFNSAQKESDNKESSPDGTQSRTPSITLPKGGGARREKAICLTPQQCAKTHTALDHAGHRMAILGPEHMLNGSETGCSVPCFRGGPP